MVLLNTITPGTPGQSRTSGCWERSYSGTARTSRSGIITRN
nr:MAG TPA: hypothetical protein [Caudoviricetes sp.]